MESTIDKYLTVAQDNRITQTAHAKNEGQELTTYQKKLILLTIGRIKKDESEFKIEKIPFKKFMDVMGISHGGNTERIIAESVETLVDKSFFIKTDDEKTKECIWVNRDVTRVDWSQKVIEIQLHNSIKEYFLNLNGYFTSFQVGFVTKFSSKYTFRVYEFLHSYLKLGKTLVRREDALKVLGNNHYKHIADFERYVLKKAIEEINEYSDISVICRKKLNKKIITHFFFLIKKKDDEDIEIIQEEWGDRKSEYEKIADELEEFIESSLDKNDPYSADEIKNNIYKSEVL